MTIIYAHYINNHYANSLADSAKGVWHEYYEDGHIKQKGRYNSFYEYENKDITVFSQVMH